MSLHSSTHPPQPETLPTLFYDVLKSYENQTLWRYFRCDGDGEWIREGVINGTLVIVHDGSYMPEVERNACEAAFMIYCTATESRAKGAAVEYSMDADNYHAEILGGLLVQLVLRVASSDPSIAFGTQRTDCDNDGVVKHGNSATRQLKENQAQADILRCFKQLVSSNNFVTDYQWVASHQDDERSWVDLSLKKRMNVLVDELAKLALGAGVVDGKYIDRDFPFEQVRISIKGKKVSGSLRKATNDHWSYITAKHFFHTRRIVNRHDFDIVYWDGVERAMHGFPKMFRAFVTKQVSRFCGTNRQLSRIDPKVENVCPSCGRTDESSKHITRCTDPGRRAMIKHSVIELTQWMSSTCVDRNLVSMVRKYLLAQASKTMMDCLSGDSTILATAAASQDRLG